MAVAAGRSHTVIVSEEGFLCACGKNNFGQLGTENLNQQNLPTRIKGLPLSLGPVMQVSAGSFHTGMVTEAGDLLMCGGGQYGRLGLGNEEDRTTPTLVAQAVFDGEAVLMVTCGAWHTAVVTEDGGVYTFGRGDDGRLGHGDEDDYLVPMLVPRSAFNGERVVMVAVGNSHTVALSEAGHVFTWGDGGFGQLGLGDQEKQLAPRQVEAGPSGQGEEVVFVAAGGYHTVAVTAGGRLYTWGYGGHGRLGHGDTVSRLVPTLVGALEGGRVVMAACADSHTLVVMQDGGLWACGNGFYAKLGLNDMEDSHVFERVGVEAFGGAKVVVAAAGKNHSAVVTADGALWTWGYNDGGQLGHVNNDFGNILMSPRQVTSGNLDRMRVGRFHFNLTREHILALYMSQHSRLGAPSVAQNLKPELLDMIVRMNTPKKGNNAISRLLGFFRTCKPCILFQH